MSSVENMEDHQNICSIAFTARRFPKEAGVVLSFSSFDYLASLTRQSLVLLQNTQTAQRGSQSTAEVYVSYYLLTADCTSVFQRITD